MKNPSDLDKMRSDFVHKTTMAILASDILISGTMHKTIVQVVNLLFRLKIMS